MGHSIYKNSLLLTYRNIKKFLFVSLFSCLAALPVNSMAAGNCSPYLGQASLNEFFKDRSNMSYDVDDFVEVKILNDTITSSVFDTWTIRICEQNAAGNNNDADGCSAAISLSTFTDKTKPWLVIDGTASSGATQIGKYVNFKTGFDAILLDGNGDVIDYLSLDGYNIQEEAGCNGSSTPSLAFDYQASAPGASDKFIFRIPDGTGDWGSAPSASAPPSEDDTNDTAPDGGKLPTITVTDVTVNKGTTATFKFTVNTDTANGVTTVKYPITINYKTTGGDAVPNTAPLPGGEYDYTEVVETSSPVIFPVGTVNGSTSTVTVNVSTNGSTPSTSNTVYFYLLLFGQTNATVINAYPIGTILGNATAEWYMDEALWNGTAQEVSDISSNANHGTAKFSLSTSADQKILCRAGLYDGSDDYIDIPHNNSLVGTNQLTYSVWIRPTVDLPNPGTSQIMSKSDLDGGANAAQMSIFSKDGKLVGRVEPVLGPALEVFTSAPIKDKWTHIALVFNGYSLTLFVDGVIAPDFSAAFPSFKFFTSTSLISNSNSLILGRHLNDPKYYFTGYIDEVLVMQSSLPAGFIKTIYDNYLAGLNWNGAVRSCPSSLHHIEFIHDSAALTCNPEPITVKACANASCSTLATSAVTVGLLPVGWVGGDSKTFTGSADYTLKHTVAETIILDIGSLSPAASSALVCKNSGGTVILCDVVFSDSGFIFSNDTDSNTIIPTQLSGKDSNIGYNAKTISLKAVKKSDSDPTQCAPAFQNKTLNINFAAECINPSTCISGQLFNLTSGGVTGNLTATTDNNTVVATSSSYDTRSISFDTDGKANIVFTYPEAGNIELHVRHNMLLADGTTASGNYMSGSSSFVVRPLGFALSGLSFATNTAGTLFTQAGEDFVTTLSAINWQAADDTNNDGIPDINATLSDNTITQNFGKESTPLTPVNVTASHVTALTNQGALSNTANSASFTNGVGTKTLAWNEVGIFDLTTTLSNYLSGGDNIIGNVQNVGRFSPHHFNTTLIYGCDPSTFTYSGQPFSVSAIARNKADTTTANYTTGSYAYNVTYSDAAISPIIYFTNNTVASTSFNNGIGIQTNVTYTFPAKDTIPTTITLRANDTDTGTSIGMIEGTTEIRSGRARLENVFGPELTPLTMPVMIEYYYDNATPAVLIDDGFILNTDDSCTTFTASSGAFTNYTGNLSSGEVAVSSTGTVAAGIENIIFHLPGDVTAGPGAGNDGAVNLLLNTTSSPGWLMYNWNIDCDNADTDDDLTTAVDIGLCGPFGTASFGLYRGDDRVIYWREVFN